MAMNQVERKDENNSKTETLVEILQKEEWKE